MKLKSLLGLDELKAQLRAIEKEARTKAAKAVREAFRPVLAQARANAPVDTGLLQKRTKMSVVKNKGKVVAAEGIVVGSNPASMGTGSKQSVFGDGPPKKKRMEMRNWAWYERGVPAHGIAAKPYIRPAFEANQSAMVSTLRDEYQKIIDDAIKRGGK